jgi:hypothetical protein
MGVDETQLLGALRELLAEVRPPKIAPEDAWLRPDRHGVDFVLPHGQLNGFALVVAMLPHDVVVHYASYEDEDYGDDFDLAMAHGPSANVSREEPEWVSRVIETVREWLGRPLVLERATRPSRRRAHVVRIATNGDAEGKPIWKGNGQELTARRSPMTAESWRFSFLD